MHKNFRAKQAFTLVEIMIAMAILSIVAMSVTGVSLMTRRMAEANIYQNTAMTVAQGYMEQIKSMEYDVVILSWEDNSLPLPTKSISALLSGSAIEIDDPLILNTENLKDIVIDIQEDQSGTLQTKVMKFSITPSINNLDTGSDPIEALEIVLDYSYLTPERNQLGWRTGAIRFVKSYAPTF